MFEKITYLNSKKHTRLLTLNIYTCIINMLVGGNIFQGIISYDHFRMNDYKIHASTISIFFNNNMEISVFDARCYINIDYNNLIS